MKKVFAILLATVALPAAAQDIPFTIRILEDERTKQDIQTAPGVTAPAQLNMRYAAERPEPQLSVQAWRTGPNIQFRGWSNYGLFVERAEVRVLEDGRTVAVLPITLGGAAVYGQPVSDETTYVLRAYDGRGRYDETRVKSMDLAGTGAPSRGELLFHSGANDLEHQSIRLNGRAITADGAGVKSSELVQFAGQNVPVQADGRFETTQIIPTGERVMKLNVTNAGGGVLTTYSQPVSVADEDFFYIGIADVTVGQNNSTGPIEAITGDDSGRFGDEIFVNGRLAFYLRGKIKGEWLLTAAADTKEGPVEDLFDNFLASDARSYLRRLDPEKYYPVYGDDSTALNDAPTDGKLYIQLERDGTELLWGNFKTTSPDSHFTNFSRSLYGARAQYETRDQNATSRKISGEVFAAEPGTVQAREEFRGTGGSLYFLRNRDILQGSERVWIETRDATTGVLISRQDLVVTQDYEVNAIQGRIQLHAPLSSSVSSGLLVGGATTGGNPQYLVVGYEHSPSVATADATVFGGSVKVQVNDRLTFGASAIRQQDGGDDQTLGGITASYQVSDGTSLEFEAARSIDAGTTVYHSLDGGFNFTAGPGGAGTAANASRVALSLDLQDAGLGNGRADLYWQNRSAGFSGPGAQTDEEITQFGADVQYALTPRTDLKFVIEQSDSTSQTVQSTEVDIGHQLTEQWKLSFGLRADDVDTRVANASSTLSTDGSRLDGVIRADYDAGLGWTAYGYVQGTFSRTGTRANNDRVGVGGTYRIGDRFTLGGEVSTGTGGSGAQISGTWQVDERTQTYLSYSLDPDSADNTTRGQVGKFTYGGSRQVNDNVYVLAEQTYHHGAGPSGVVNAFGVDLTPGDKWSFGLRAETGDLSDPLSGDIERRAASLSAAYSREKISFSSVFEYRVDEGVDTRETLGFHNKLAYQVSDDWRFLGRLGAVYSESSDASVNDTEFVELVTGFAYRPVENDRLNALFRYTYLYDTASPGQVGSNGLAIDMAQRSHVVSADAIYEINNTLSLGGKLGARMGEVRLPGAGWTSSDAFLAIIRADIKLRPKWDILGEYRFLSTPDANSDQAGALVGVYRRFNENLRAGIGYNSTDFSDDLTNQSYSSEGLFFNVIGKF